LSVYDVAIIGGGSVGLALAASFVRAGARVSLLVRPASLAKVSGQAIRVSGILGDVTISSSALRVVDASAPDPEVLGASMLILTTKAHDVAEALAPFAAAGHCPPILSMQNGMGSAEIAKATVGETVPIYSSAMMIGMVRDGPASVAITAQSSPVFCGAVLDDPEEPLLEMLAVAERGLIPMAHDPKIRETIAWKLLFNSCMNPTGALTGLTYGALLETPETRALIAGLADETLAAFEAAFDYRPAESGRAYVDGALSDIVFPRATGHQSSMLQDIRAGRRTEIDMLNGAVIRLADAHGLPCTRHRTIVQLIEACNGTA